MTDGPGTLPYIFRQLLMEPSSQPARALLQAENEPCQAPQRTELYRETTLVGIALALDYLGLVSVESVQNCTSSSGLGSSGNSSDGG